MKKTYIRPMAEAINLNLESPIMGVSNLSTNDNTPMVGDDPIENIFQTQRWLEQRFLDIERLTPA